MVKEYNLLSDYMCTKGIENFAFCVKIINRLAKILKEKWRFEMRKVGFLIKKNIRWIVTVWFVLVALVYFPAFCGIVCAAIAALVVPIQKWQDFIKKYISKKTKIISVIILLFLWIATTPSAETDENDAPDRMMVGAAQETIETTVEITESTTTELEITTEIVENTTTESETEKISDSETEEAAEPEVEIVEENSDEPEIIISDSSRTIKSKTTQEAVTVASVAVQPTTAVAAQTATAAATQATTEASVRATTAAPIQATVASNTGITFVSYPATVSRNQNATVTIKGAPNTTYSITVYYKSGPSEAEGLEAKVSDGDGYVSWSWKVGGRTSEGTFRIVVSGGGVSETVYFTVVV